MKKCIQSSIIRKPLLLAGLIVAMLVGPVTRSVAQCNCKFTIPAGAAYYYFDGAAKGVLPGDVICVSGGSHSSTIEFVNVTGSATNPVIIKNCGGQALIGGPTTNNGMLFTGSKYVHVTGTGDSGFTYGLKVVQTVTGSQGLAYAGLSSDIEVDHMEIAKAGYVGIMAKTDPSRTNCADVSAVRPNFTLYNVFIHDNYIHDCGGEGIYLGDSFYTGTTTFCGSMQYCHEVRGVRIYNNRFENTGREAIQVGSAVKDVEIYNNKVYNYGTGNLTAQNGGVQLGVGTAARLYNNFIKGGTGPAIAVQGIGGDYVYNNVIVNPGEEGITINTRPTPLSTDIVNKGYIGGVYVMNNTIVNAPRGAIIEYQNGATGNVLYNNLIVASAPVWDLTYPTTDWLRSNNLAIPLLANAKFVNPGADDYRLLTGSPAIDVGKNVASFGVTYDGDKKNRPVGTSFDIGAFEFGASLGVPVSNAGTDKTLTLPANSITLTGTASDAGGSISAYAWTKQSGPAATLVNASTANLALSGLVAGTYIFRLTVTDNSALTAFDEVTLTVSAVGGAPIVSAGADKTLTLPMNSTTLIGNASDAGGSISAYAWTKQSGPAATLANANTASLALSGLVAGSYVFRLTATDNSALTAFDEVALTVSVAGGAPVVNAGIDKTLTLPMNSTTLTGTASDAGGTITAYAWTKLSGPLAALLNAGTASLGLGGLVAGTYIFRLTATDNSGLAAFDDVMLTVSTIGLPPVVNAGADKVLTLPSSSFILTATASDPDGTIAAYSWTRQSGPAATLSGITTVTLSASNLLAGTYIFRLTVTDNSAKTAFDEVKVTVNPAVASTVLYRINTGGGVIVDTPMNWSADTQTTKSAYLGASSANYTCGTPAWAGTTNTTGAPDDIFGANRYNSTHLLMAPMVWNFPVTSGTYEVRLFFAETPYAGGVNAAGARVFSIAMEGNTVLANYDIYGSVGMGAAKKVFQVNVTDGILNINFIAVTGNPQINGIEIVSAGGGAGARTDVVTGEEEHAPATETTMEAYPNPFTDTIHVPFESEQPTVAVSLIDMSGHVVYSETQNNVTLLTLDLATVSMPNGVYILVVKLEGKQFSQRVMKR